MKDQIEYVSLDELKERLAEVEARQTAEDITDAEYFVSLGSGSYRQRNFNVPIF